MAEEQGLHKHPAIQAYRDAAHRYPPTAMYQTIIEEVGDDEEMVKLLWEVVREWVGRGWNPSNAVGILDVFKNRRGAETKVREWTDPETGLRYCIYADGYRELIMGKEKADE
jgi:putative SOS response-associated peptidase YedK